jgi:uncharacterized membrane protein YbhN (UPF0104 family)
LRIQKKIWFKFLQLVVVLLAGWFLYSELSAGLNWELLFTFDEPSYFAYILFLFPLNLGLEAAKWWKLTRSFGQLSYSRSVSSVLIGHFYTLFTPNRIGDGAGRLHFLAPGNKTRATWAFINGSMSQFLCTLVVGSLGLAIIQQWTIETDATWWIYAQWMRWPVWLATIILLLLYIEPGWVTLAIDSSKEDGWFGKRVRTLQHYSRRQNAGTLVLSALRYVTFATQMYFALKLYGISGDAFEIYLRIGILYLATTLIPTAALAEFGVRESLAILLFPAAGISEEGAFAATLLVWLVNLLFPAILGGILFTRLQPSKK